MTDKNIQWHPGFVAAMNLEFAENREQLIYEKEYNLNTKPLEIDLLVIKKEEGAQIKNEIGKLFRRYNIMEYKSPEDSLDIDVFYKVGAYASLYKSYGETVDKRKVEDITVSIVREKKPEKLFSYFDNHKVKIENPYHGIYYICNNVLFLTQIVVTKELDKENHAWLKALSSEIPKQDMRELLQKVYRIREKFDRELADSVLDVSIRANSQIIEELMTGDDGMCNALIEIMQPEIQKREILAAIRTSRSFGHDDEEIKGVIMREFGISSEIADLLIRQES